MLPLVPDILLCFDVELQLLIEHIKSLDGSPKSKHIKISGTFVSVTLYALSDSLEDQDVRSIFN